MSGTKSFPADNVKLHIASAADAPTGTMTVLMRTNRYYTDGSLLQTGEQYTVTKEWGQDALSRNWCEDVADVFPETETPSGLTADEVSLIRGVVSGDGIVPHPRYWFHGSAVRQSADDGVFRDMVAGNHGVFGANLSRANAWTNRGSGYVSTVDPVGGSTDSVIRIPGPNYDYAGGESLFILWAGQVTPEGSDASLMGTSASTSANGVRIRAGSAGRLSFVLYDTTPTSAYSTTSTDNALGKPFVSGERHSFAIFIDGRNRLQYMWIDGIINVNALTLSSGTSVNTLSSGTWNIGAASQSPGGTEGIASKTLAFAGFKFLATDDLPAIADLTAVAQAFDRDPSALVAQGAM